MPLIEKRATRLRAWLENNRDELHTEGHSGESAAAAASLALGFTVTVDDLAEVADVDEE